MAMRYSTQMFFVNRVSKTIVLYRNDVKNYSLFITVFIAIRWVKPALPFEPVLFTSTLLNPAGRRW